ncbi:MAG TPA: diguanylate cyclase [Azospira sp.]|nr:diguanylate cyclase [Azospira sp.]HNN07649.1 diguanylate cyclase [Azospira sp.]HNN44778.1 diguanylate cyclase [Azospira sp.]
MKEFGIPATAPELSGATDSFRFLSAPENVLVFTLDRSGRCDFVSPSWVSHTGCRRSEELGSGWLERVHPDDRPTVESGLKAALHDIQPLRQLFRIRGRNGAFRWFVNHGMPRTDPTGVAIGYLGLCFDVTAYQDGDFESERTAQHMISLLRHTRLIAVVLDRRGHVEFSNGSLCRLLKYSGVELMDFPLFERLAAPASRDLVAELFPDGEQAPHFPTEFETALLDRDGEPCTVSWHAVVMRDRVGTARHTILIGDDVTELRQTETQMAMSARIFGASHHAMLVTTLTGEIVEVNPAFTTLTGYTRDEVIGKNPRLLQSGRHDAAFYTQLWDRLLATGHWYGDIWDRRKDGSIYPKYLSISVVCDEAGNATHYSGIFYDISERKTVEERLDRLAHYDVLTGLPNRSLLMDRLEQLAERSDRDGGRIGVLYLDLDHFKEVNDTLGHAAGDALLKEAAQRMKNCLRAIDTVARLGGDEFVILVPDVAQRDDLAQVARKIIDALLPPCVIEGRTAVTVASIGISVYPDDGTDVHDVVRHADAAMYQVKQAGRGFYRFFDAGDQ